jgi:hypothetical protein
VVSRIAPSRDDPSFDLAAAMPGEPLVGLKHLADVARKLPERFVQLSGGDVAAKNTRSRLGGLCGLGGTRKLRVVRKSLQELVTVAELHRLVPGIEPFVEGSTEYEGKLRGQL